MAKPISKKSRSGAPTLRVVTGGRSAPEGRDTAAKAAVARRATERTGRGKRVQFDLETWHALDMLGRDRMMKFQELADEAFRDLLSKHGRPIDLKDALKRSLHPSEPQEPDRPAKGGSRRRR